MAVRLSKIAREFNVGISTLVEFLHNKGIKISTDPNAKLTDEDYALVAKEFSADSKVKQASSLVDLKGPRQKKESVNIKTPSSQTPKEKETNSNFISISDEVKIENQIKIVDRIDLNAKQKSGAKPEKTQPKEKKAEAPISPATPVTPEKPKMETPVVQTEKEEKVVKKIEQEEKKSEYTETQPVKKEEKRPHIEENTQDEDFSTRGQSTLKDVKVVGSIDLNAINQRTRPPKKSKFEKYI